MKTLDEIERPSGKHDIFINDRLPSTQCVEKQFLISLFGIVPPGRPKTFRSKERSVL